MTDDLGGYLEGEDGSTLDIATALGRSEREFLVEYGRFHPTQRVASDECRVERWWVSGMPKQVLLGVDKNGAVWVAEPRLNFNGPIPAPGFMHAELLGGEESGPAQVDAVARRTRRRFRYCPQCRTASPPEGFNASARVCDGCAASLGVAF